jgi:Flp pilus assembly protein TadG
MMVGRANRFATRWGSQRSEGDATVACAAALPLLILAVAVGADYAKVSHFRSRVQVAADAASVAAAEAIARQAGADSDALAGQIADSVFLGQAPHGAGTPTVDVKSHAAAVTATVGYAGLAPSNFGSAFGYDSVSADASSTSPARVADFRLTVAR